MVIKKERIDSLHTIRAMGFMSIFLTHLMAQFPGDGKLYVLFHEKSPGRMAACVFFILSGFVMTYSYWNRPLKLSIKDAVFFTIIKIKRLYPLHLLMLFWGALFSFLNHKPVISICKHLATEVPLLQTWFPVGYYGVNAVAWYLSVSVFLYFCFPYLLMLIKKRKHDKTISLLVIACIFLTQLIVGFCAFHFTDVDIKWVTYCHPVFRLGDFVIGMSLASLYMNRRVQKGSVKLSKVFYL